MYVHVDAHRSPLLCFVVIVPLLRGNRGDRFHLWSRMVMTGKGKRGRRGDSQREKEGWSSRFVQVSKPGSPVRQDEESCPGIRI